MRWWWKPWRQRRTVPQLGHRVGAARRRIWADLVCEQPQVAPCTLAAVLNEPTMILNRPLLTRGQRWRAHGGGPLLPERQGRP